LIDKKGKQAATYATNADVRLALGLEEFTDKQGRRISTMPATGKAPRDASSKRRASVANVTTDVASLFEAISEGDYDIVLEQLNQGVAVNSLDDDGNTPLIMAAEGEEAIVELLLERGADVDTQNRNGVTALIAAVKYEDTDLVSTLLQAGAQTTIRDRKGRSAADFAGECAAHVQQNMLSLFDVKGAAKAQKAGKNRRRRKSMVYVDQQTRELLEAVSNGNFPKVRELIADDYPVNAQDDDGNTALIYAAENEPLIVTALLKAGAQPDHQNRSGTTALMVAIRHQDMDSMRKLLAANASSSITNHDGKSPIDFARETGSEAIVRLVFGISENLESKERSKPALPMEVMRRGSLPSCSSQDRRTRAFFEAISEGDTTRVERILSIKREGLEPFDVNSLDDQLNCPLHFAVEGTPELVEMLLKYGAKIDMSNNEGLTPLMAALRFADVQSTEMLIQELQKRPDEKNAVLEAKDNKGRENTWYAESSGSSIIENLLREASR